MSRPRVALLALSMDDSGGRGGGTERACAELVRRGRTEVDYVVLTSDLPPDLHGTVEWHRIRLPRRPAALRDIVFFAQAGWRLRRVDAAIRHATGAIVPNRISLASVHYCHVGFRSSTGRRMPIEGSLTRRLNTAIHRFVAELAERWVYRPERSACLAAVSNGVAKELREHFPGVDVVVAPNGVDVDRFRPDPEVRRRLRGDLEVNDGEVVALFIGGDWPRKGLEVAVRAVGLARAEGLPVQLWIVGDGDERRLARVAASSGAGSAVRFFGRRNDTERFYAAADLFLLPSSYETFSLVAYEAAACGLPVVATSVSGIAELVLEGRGGLLVDATPDSVLAALRRLVSNDVDRSVLGAAGREWARRFTWEASANATLDLYRRLATPPVAAWADNSSQIVDRDRNVRVER
jgi:glycosyltransferase involved in cell wall biosynthesis